MIKHLLILTCLMMVGCQAIPQQPIVQEVNVEVMLSTEVMAELIAKQAEQVKENNSTCSADLLHGLIEIKDVNKKEYQLKGDVAGYTRALSNKLSEYKEMVDITARKFASCNK